MFVCFFVLLMYTPPINSNFDLKLKEYEKKHFLHLKQQVM